MANPGDDLTNLGDGGSISNYFRKKGLFVDQKVEAVFRLSGGVSCDTYRVKLSKGDVIMKKALARLRVEKEWLSSPERAFNEFKALSFASDILPKGSVPLPYYFDETQNIVIMAAAPASYQDWKSLLLRGKANGRIAEILGDDLSKLHMATRGKESLELQLKNGSQFFRELRLDPYFQPLIVKYPALKQQLQDVIHVLETKRRCIVHGDFSPKNVLTDSRSGVMIIDWEVVHYGNPAFDVAFMSNHLTLKLVHVGRDNTEKYLKLLSSFCDRYFSRIDKEVVDFQDFSMVLGALLLARVDGKSPAEYLNEEDKKVVRSLSRQVLTNGFSSLKQYYEMVSKVFT
jgi:tRNA A-37 threonylcarbamoyl transferase component Bud32